jgi:FAD/FMN-containing dehydrogenase
MSDRPTLPPRLLRQLVEIVGADHVLTDAGLMAGFEIDWTRRFSGAASAVVRPADTAQVSALLAVLTDAGVGVTPQGGNTGLVGGSVPRDGDVVLSLLRLRSLDPVDTLAGEVTAGAGVTLGVLQAHAAAAGLALGVDFGARDSATVGGAIATNAGGINVLRHGPMRSQLIGLEAVLADGTVVRRLPGMPKDNSGYHLPSLLAGSEGTLAVITRARLRLVPRPPRQAVALVALPSVAAAVRLAATLRGRVPGLQALELFEEPGMALVMRHSGVPRPFAAPAPAYLLVEAGGDDPEAPLLDAAAASDEIIDAVSATDPAGRDRLWALRERHTEAINAEGIPHKLDVSVPIGSLADFAERVRTVVSAAASGSVLYLYGHIGDGNLHVNVVGPAPEDEAVDDAVLGLVCEFGGSISAEHGIGRAKVGWLERDRGAADVALMRSIKHALDPRGILNPGVVLADSTVR